MLRTFHASGFLGSLAFVLPHSTRICELPKSLANCLLCGAGRADLFYQKPTWKGLGFWIFGFVNFCSHSLHSPLRITKNQTRTDYVCGWLSRDSLLETMKLSFDASGVLSSPPSIPLEYTRLSKSTKSYHQLPMLGRWRSRKKRASMIHVLGLLRCPSFTLLHHSHCLFYQRNIGSF